MYMCVVYMNAHSFVCEMCNSLTSCTVYVNCMNVKLDMEVSIAVLSCYLFVSGPVAVEFLSRLEEQ